MEDHTFYQYAIIYYVLSTVLKHCVIPSSYQLGSTLLPRHGSDYACGESRAKCCVTVSYSSILNSSLIPQYASILNNCIMQQSQNKIDFEIYMYN